MVSIDYQHLDRRRLRIFFYIKRYGGFGKARNRLKMEKSGMIEAMNELESKMGKLFIRNEKEQRVLTKLTDLGELIYSRMKEKNIVEQWKKEQKDPFIENLKNGIRKYYKVLEGGKKVIFRTSETIRLTYLPDILLDFKKKYPEIIIDVDSTYPEEGIQLITNDKIDFYYFSSFVLNKQVPKDVENRLFKEFSDFIPINEFKWILISKPTKEFLDFTAKAKKGKLSKKEIYEKIAQFPLVFRSGLSYNRELLEKRFLELGIKKWNIAGLKKSIPGIKTDVLKNGVISHVAEVSFLPGEKENYATLELDLKPDKFGIVYKRGKQFSNASKIFINFLANFGGGKLPFPEIPLKK